MLETWQKLSRKNVIFRILHGISRMPICSQFSKIKTKRYGNTGVYFNMIKAFLKITCMALLITSLEARGPRAIDIGVSPQEIGSPGVMWYATWESALAEAKRSQRPIFFMAAAAQCNGISGVF